MRKEELQIQEILWKMDLLALGTVDSDTCVSHMALSACVQSILRQEHSSKRLQIIPEMTWGEPSDSVTSET